MNQQCFNFRGKTYLAHECYGGRPCELCDFNKESGKNCVKLHYKCEIPPCHASDRKDGKEVYFRELKSE